MKKRVINLTLFIATVLIGMNSCTNRKASVTEDVYNISSQDTAAVLKLASSCMDALQEGRTEAALEMMYVTRNDTLMPISNEQKVNMARRFKLFPVLDYTLESFGFSQYTGNEVKFRVKFAEEDAADNKPAAYTSLRFCPVKYNADWYLTIESE